jgi:hypothetical protein
VVLAGLPRREGPEESAHRRHWRAPTAFNTVRYSERIFETSGITIETLDLSEVFGRINR